MEYLTYLLHANPQELNEIEKEFVDAFLDRGFDAYPSGRFSLGVQMHLEDVKQYVHDNLIKGREKWKLGENGLSDTDIFNILGSDKRINAFNQKFEKIYNADLVKNLWDEAQEELKAKDKINNFDAPTDAPEQYDIAKEMYKTLQICNAKEIKEKNKLPVDITLNQSKFFKGLLMSLGVSLAIFLALKFIFDVVAIWSLIIFPVVPVIIFFVCIFSFKDKFEKITYPSKIKVLISNNKNLIEQENQLNLKLDEMKMNEIITEKKK